MLQKDVPKEMSYCSCGNGFGNDTAYTFYKDIPTSVSSL